MQYATWNVNSLSVRLPQVLDWLAANPVDVLVLQELKLTDDKFPREAFSQAGYHAQCFGQKTYNGVALLSRTPATDVIKNIPGFDDDMARLITGTVGEGNESVRVVGAYFPNGQEPGSDKFEYKMEWLKGLRTWLKEELVAHPRLLFLGDILAVPHAVPLANVYSVGDVCIAIGAAIGCMTSDPLPPAHRIGARLIMTTATVINFGLRRCTAPSIAASSIS